MNLVRESFWKQRTSVVRSAQLSSVTGIDPHFNNCGIKPFKLHGF